MTVYVGTAILILRTEAVAGKSYEYFRSVCLCALPPCSLPLQGFVKDCRAALGFETEGQLLLLHILALLHAQKALHLAPFLTLLVLFILLL